MLLHDRAGGRRGHGRAEELVEWARDALEQGLDGSALRMLAGESRPYDSGEVGDLLAAVLDELRLSEPRDRDELTDAAVLLVCHALVLGNMRLDPALDAIWKIVVAAGYPRRFAAWSALTSIPADEAMFVDDLPRDALRLALETVRAVAVPAWLPSYLALDLRAD